jgi:Flp pilus assembly protein TadG
MMALRRVAARATAGAPSDRDRALHSEDGQATVELVAAIPALLLAALISLQLLAAGYALTLADGAAEAGALALAEGGSAAEAAREALPGWAADDVKVTVSGEEVSVRLRPPSPFASIADHLAVTSSASARSAE